MNLKDLKIGQTTIAGYPMDDESGKTGIETEPSLNPILMQEEEEVDGTNLEHIYKLLDKLSYTRDMIDKMEKGAPRYDKLLSDEKKLLKKIERLERKEKNEPRRGRKIGANKKALGKGGCFDKVADYVMEQHIHKTGSDTKIVHGIIVGQGPIEGIEHGHAWLQKGNLVIDLENNITMPVAKYEKLARLKYKKVYTIKEAIAQITKTGYKGPWDKKIISETKKAFKKLNLKYGK